MNTERGQSKLNGGKMLMRAVGMAGKDGSRQTQPAEQALQADTASGFSARHRPQNTRPQMTGLAAKTTAAADEVGLSPCR